ncbi:MAG: ATP-binding cassette domain-containing protein [Spirochaetes bacterium]|nr:MAG: ATP-binding cassette domain-containing protein [Spirochaetota bacterium]
MKEKIRIVDLHKGFAGKTVLAGVNLSVYEGEILCVIGKSGSGKSVILKHLVGIIRPDSGDIFVEGVPFTGSDEMTRIALQSRYGILFQGAALFDSLSIYDNIAFGLRRKHVPEEEIARRVPELLGMVGLRGIEDKMPSEISGGTQKRVGLARSIAMKPEIMLYDEPTTGVDPITAGSVDRLIRKMRDDLGITSVVVTHDMKSVSRVADRVAMLLDGVIVFDGAPAELMASGDERLRQFVEGRAHGPIKVA